MTPTTLAYCLAVLFGSLPLVALAIVFGPDAYRALRRYGRRVRTTDFTDPPFDPPRTVIRLSRREAETVERLLAQPPQPTEALKRAAARWRVSRPRRTTP